MTDKERLEKIEKNFDKIKKLTAERDEINKKIEKLERENFVLANYEKITKGEYPFKKNQIYF